LYHRRGFAITRLTGIRRTLWVPLTISLAIWLTMQAAAAQSQPAFRVAPNLEGRKASELNVSITVLDPGVPEDPLEQRRLQVVPRIREIEGILLPFMFRQTLVEAGEWGAVRVLPAPDYAAELLVSGAIVRSDGDVLELKIRAIDASGREWMDKEYTSAATGGSQGDTRMDLYGYQALFTAIADDLRTARALLDDRALADIVDISFLRYAYDLAPSVFSGYLRTSLDGRIEIQRLPADDDPMSERIERAREVEYQLIDTVDEKFQELHAEIGAIYDLWLDYRRQVAQFESSEVDRVRESTSNAPRGSYEAIRSLYDNYRLARMQQQRRDGRAQAFSNEVGPAVDKLETRVAELQTWLAQQDQEWRRILKEIFVEETGLDNPAF
jgi:hypothetical protein